MAKLSSIEKNNRRRRMSLKYQGRRQALKTTISNKLLSAEDRFEAILKLAGLPRNSSKVRIRNRCEISGRPRSYYRKFKMSRIALREFASQGLIPGMTKAS